MGLAKIKCSSTTLVGMCLFEACDCQLLQFNGTKLRDCMDYFWESIKHIPAELNEICRELC